MDRTLTICNASAGSGKTFTLAAYYVACLLESPNPGSYRSVLAVTFTIKATAEMKDRILTQLYALGQGSVEPQFLDKVKQVLRLRGCELTDETIRERSKKLFEDMLAHYEDISVTTIDSFLQILFNGLAQTVGLSANYDLELDIEHLISTSVDQLLSTHIDEQEGLQKEITDYLTQRLEGEKSWDIRRSLCRLAKELFNESVQERTTDDDFDRERIKAFKEAIRWINSPGADDLKKAYDEVQQHWTEILPDKGETYYSSFMRRVEALFQEIKPKEYKGLSDRELKRLEAGNALLRLNELYEREVPAYKCRLYTLEHLDDMRLLTYLRNRIRTNLAEANSVLLSETANKLAQALQPGDADFILEKAGIRYRHILLDEFQDTSTLQWRNFYPLIAEILAAGGTTLIVGDTKQSIYRFRNGNRHLMDQLDKTFAGYERREPLRRNFRSCREVVQFNLDLFRRLPGMVHTTSGEPITLYEEGYTDRNLDDYYVSGAHEGGYVSFRAYPYDNDSQPEVQTQIALDMFTQMEDLLRRGVPAKDMMILVRYKTDADPAMRLFRQLRENSNDFPLLSRCEIVSSDSFTLDSSRSVCVAVSALKYICRDDSVARAYIRYARPEVDPEALKDVKTNIPLTEMLDEAIRICLCPNGSFEGDDILYVNSLQDKVREYVGRYGANVEAFLTYWDDTLHATPIGAAETSAIRLMTVHKSKGLEAKNVFIPACNWEMIKKPCNFKPELLWCEPAVKLSSTAPRLSLVPVTKKDAMRESGYGKVYDQEYDEELVDNLNLLYVALTRAAERLFLYADLPLSAAEPAHQADSVGSLLLHACGLAEEFAAAPDVPYVEHTAGSLEWTRAKKSAAKTVKPFSFADAQSMDATFHLEPMQVEFRQSQNSFQYTMYGPEQGQANLDRRAFGNICHDILAQVKKCDEVPQVVDLFVRQGIIRDEVVRARVLETIGRAWQHPEMCDWFSGRYELLREETILLPERLREQFTKEVRSLDRGAEEVTEQRPDRVMTLGEEAIVLDYKFGAMNERVYFPQVRRYMLLMRELGYTRVQGFIWAAESNELIPVEL